MIHRISLFFAMSASLFCSADMEDHFKKPMDKSGSCQMRNIDFIYLINLDQRPEKFESCLQELVPWGIIPYRFSAVNGWELSMETVNGLGVRYESWMTAGHWGTFYQPDGDGQPQHEVVSEYGKNYFCHCMSRGAIGIAMSHLSILQDAYDSGYQTIWVMEDDVEVIRDPRILPDLIDRLDALVGKEGWDILFTDQDTKNSDGKYIPCTAFAWRPNYAPSDSARFQIRQDVGSDFRRIGARYGAYSMIVRRSGMKKILNFIKGHQIFLPFDMDFTLPNNIRFYTVTEDVVSTQPRASSDNGAPNYLEKYGL